METKTSTSFRNAEDVVEHQIQVGETGNVPQATSNQTQPLAAADRTNQFSEHMPAQPDDVRGAGDLEQGTLATSFETLPVPPQNVQHVSEERPQETMTEEERIWKKGTKIAIWATSLSAACLIGLVVAFIGSKNAHQDDKQFFLAFAVMFMFVSFICGVAMLGLWVFGHHSPNMTGLVRILMLGCIAGAILGVLFVVAFFMARML